MIKLVNFVTRRSGNLETAYDQVTSLGFLLASIINLVRFLNLYMVMCVPSIFHKQRETVKDVFRPKLGDIVADASTCIGRYTLIAP